jgi:hypothetical protein
MPTIFLYFFGGSKSGLKFEGRNERAHSDVVTKWHVCMLPSTDKGGDLDPELRHDARRAVHYVASRFAWEQSARGHSLGRRAETDSPGQKSGWGKSRRKSAYPAARPPLSLRRCSLMRSSAKAARLRQHVGVQLRGLPAVRRADLVGRQAQRTAEIGPGYVCSGNVRSPKNGAIEKCAA